MICAPEGLLNGFVVALQGCEQVLFIRLQLVMRIPDHRESLRRSSMRLLSSKTLTASAAAACRWNRCCVSYPRLPSEAKIQEATGGRRVCPTARLSIRAVEIAHDAEEPVRATTGLRSERTETSQD